MNASRAPQRPANLVLLAAVILYGLVLTGRSLSPWAMTVVGVLGGAMMVAAHGRFLKPDIRQKPALAWVGAALAFHGFATPLFFWPLHLLVPLLLVVLLAWLGGWIPELRQSCRFGRFAARDLPGIGLVTVVAGAGLHIWLILANPNLTDLKAMIPPLPGIALLAAGAAFSLVNAMLEEIAWRGILMHWLLTWMRPIGALTLQALSFGFAHWNGFPNGWAGVLLSGSYGLIMGWLVLRSGGLLPAIVAHIIVDVVIFASLASS